MPNFMKTIINGKGITRSIWALSMVCRKEGPDHAFLVLEGITSEGVRVTETAELVYDKDDHTKARIIHGSYDAEKLKGRVENYKAYTYNRLLLSQVKEFRKLVKEHKNTAKKGELNYIKLGKTRSAESCESMIRVKGDSAKKTRIKFFDESSKVSDNMTNSLLRDGHNCMSFVIDVWTRIPLEYEDTLLGKFFVVHPKEQINHQIKYEKGGSSCPIL